MSKTGFDALMEVVCPQWGFCGSIKFGEPIHVTDFIPPSGPVHADQFVEWIILADNLNPNLPEFDRHKSALRAAFISHMGGETVDASRLRWSEIEYDSEEPDAKFRGPLSE